MKILVLFALLFSLPALACWRAEGSLAVDGETWKFDQKIQHDKEYVFPMGSFIFKFTISKMNIRYVVQEKKGMKLTDVTIGDEEGLVVGKQREIYAKGFTGQPNSIITIKLNKI